MRDTLWDALPGQLTIMIMFRLCQNHSPSVPRSTAHGVHRACLSLVVQRTRARSQLNPKTHPCIAASLTAHTTNSRLLRPSSRLSSLAVAAQRAGSAFRVVRLAPRDPHPVWWILHKKLSRIMSLIHLASLAPTRSKHVMVTARLDPPSGSLLPLLYEFPSDPPPTPLTPTDPVDALISPPAHHPAPSGNRAAHPRRLESDHQFPIPTQSTLPSLPVVWPRISPIRSNGNQTGPECPRKAGRLASSRNTGS